MAKFTLKKEANNYTSIVCIMLLFLVFTSLALTLVLIGANSYKFIKKQTDVTFNSGALASYISNKIHSNDNGNISVSNIDGIDVLTLVDDSELYKTFIYCDEGTVYENLVKSEDEFIAGRGEAMYEAEAVLFDTIKDNIIKTNIIVNETNKVETYAYVNTKLAEEGE